MWWLDQVRGGQRWIEGDRGGLRSCVGEECVGILVYNIAR